MARDEHKHPSMMTTTTEMSATEVYMQIRTLRELERASWAEYIAASDAYRALPLSAPAEDDDRLLDDVDLTAKRHTELRHAITAAGDMFAEITGESVADFERSHAHTWGRAA